MRARIAAAGVAVALPLVLGGCQTTSVSSAQRLLNACSDYQGALDAVVTHGELGNLTLEQLKTVKQVTTVPTAVCTGDLRTPDGTPLTPADALRLVENAYVDLLTIQQGVE